MSEEATSFANHLDAVGQHGDEAVELLATALVLGAHRPDLAETSEDIEQAQTVDLTPYIQHGEELVEAARDLLQQEVAGSPELDDLLSVVNAVLYDQFSYQGDTENYDSLDNSSLLSVIDRRRGLPISLGILYIHLIRALGGSAEGLNFPGHFLLSVSAGGQKVVVDPFHGGERRPLSWQRAMLKHTLGPEQPLSSEYTRSISDRMILLRLQNNIKIRLLEAERVDAALSILNTMIRMAPTEAVLWREAANLQSEQGNVFAARQSLQTFMTLSEDPTAVMEAATVLQNLSRQLH
ncbi:SirB1 family protein [Kiloniella sp. b19]|uniref:SirB1 family protein n=1 Tax=Kiloniella sp. GXU_MW_B19 TaxID=3141326 RepID=UPI0031DACC60